MTSEEMTEVLKQTCDSQRWTDDEQDLIYRIQTLEASHLLAAYIVYLQEVSGIRRLK